MVKEVSVVTKCNVCGGTDAVEEFTITRDGSKREVDLCGQHKGPLIELYDVGTEPQAAPAPGRRGRGAAPTRHAVVAIEDWEQGKS